MTSRDDRRQARLAKALRENLKRRKAGEEPPASEKAAPPPVAPSTDERD